MPQVNSVNDFVVKFANVNGSGSASANEMFARSILRMGVPVASRNIFPSNIQGLPTWYEVRVSGHGWLGRRGGVDLMVAMNPQTWDKDIASIDPGGYLFYDSSRPIPLSRFRDDINIIRMPLTEISNTAYSDPRQRQLFKNIIYVGALAQLLGIEIEVLEKLIGEQYKGKNALIAPNHKALRMGYDHAQTELAGQCGLKIARADAVGDRIFVSGNDAAGLGCVYGGATVAAWYPITPSTSVAEAFAKHCRKYRTDAETGKAKYAIVQSEDEISAIGTVIGAGWNGARAFTATSGPGISLMQEFLGLAYFAEIPAVIIDVQRGGPSTGMPTRTQQADLLICAYASHGDTKHVLLLPKDPRELFEFCAASFDLAERLQTPVFVLEDLDIGMNDWLCEPFTWDDSKLYDRGKIMTADELEAGKTFGRYLDVDGDAIPYRTLPGTHPTKGAYFTRGTSRDRFAKYSEEGAVYQDNMQRLLRKFETAKSLVPAPVITMAKGKGQERTKHGLIFFGSSAPAAREALAALAEDGIHLDRMRIRAFPFPEAVSDFINAYDQVFLVEQNRDAQMRSLLVNECGIDPARFISILHYDGTPITARFIIAAVAERLAVSKKGSRGMTYIAKPKLRHPGIPVNTLGFTHRDYEGTVSTLCAGCGHDSISFAIMQACFELSIEPHRVAKLSGIGCSSKTPDYLLGQSHGFNSVHGRMPSVLTGANLANRDLLYLGVSGDGDSASIGLGQFVHCVRRGVNMVYITENNGVYGLTKGQFSATADKGSKSKAGGFNADSPLDLVSMALLVGATFVGRSFSGDKDQMVPLIMAALSHPGPAFIDIVSPCVAFNNHAGSTKAYDFVRAHNEAVNRLDIIEPREAIRIEYAPGTTEEVALHDGSTLKLAKLAADYDPFDRIGAMNYLQSHAAKGELVTGLIYMDSGAKDMHANLNTVAHPLNMLSEKELCPGSKGLDSFNAAHR